MRAFDYDKAADAQVFDAFVRIETHLQTTGERALYDDAQIIALRQVRWLWQIVRVLCRALVGRILRGGPRLFRRPGDTR